MGIPRRFWDARFDLVDDRLKPRLLKYANQLYESVRQGVGFFFFGPSGRGKTSAGVVLLKFAFEMGRSALFVSVKELREAIREDTMFDASETLMERARSVDMLLLDDLYREDFKNFTLGLSDIESLLSTRSARGKATILTTRLDIQELRTEAQGLLSPLRGSFVWHRFDGRDFHEEAQVRLLQRFGEG